MLKSWNWFFKRERVLISYPESASNDPCQQYWNTNLLLKTGPNQFNRFQAMVWQIFKPQYWLLFWKLMMDSLMIQLGSKYWALLISHIGLILTSYFTPDILWHSKFKWSVRVFQFCPLRIPSKALIPSISIPRSFLSPTVLLLWAGLSFIV